MMLNEQQQEAVVLDRMLARAASRARVRTASRAHQRQIRPLWPRVLVAGAWVPGGAVLLAMALSYAASGTGVELFLLGLGLAPLGMLCSLAGAAFVGRHLNGAVLLSSVLTFLINVGLLVGASTITIDL